MSSFSRNHPTAYLDALGELKMFRPENRKRTLDDSQTDILEQFVEEHGWKSGYELGVAIKRSKLVEKLKLTSRQVRYQISKMMNVEEDDARPVFQSIPYLEFMKIHQKSKVRRVQNRERRRNREKALKESGKISRADIFDFQNEHLLEEAYEEHPYVEGERLDDLITATMSTKHAVLNWFQRERDMRRMFLGDEGLRPKMKIRVHPDAVKNIMIAFYKRKKFPSPDEYNNLAAQFGMQRKIVRDWFKNRRKKEKRAFRIVRRKLGMTDGKRLKVNRTRENVLLKAFNQWPYCSKLRAQRIVRQIGNGFTLQKLRNWWGFRLGFARLHAFFVPRENDPHGHLRWKREAVAREKLLRWLEKLKVTRRRVQPARLEFLGNDSTTYHLPPHCSLDIREWKTSDVCKWLDLSVNLPGVRDQIKRKGWDGRKLWEIVNGSFANWFNSNYGSFVKIRREVFLITNMKNGHGGQRAF